MVRLGPLAFPDRLGLWDRRGVLGRGGRVVQGVGVTRVLLALREVSDLRESRALRAPRVLRVLRVTAARWDLRVSREPPALVARWDRRGLPALRALLELRDSLAPRAPWVLRAPRVL